MKLDEVNCADSESCVSGDSVKFATSGELDKSVDSGETCEKSERNIFRCASISTG